MRRPWPTGGLSHQKQTQSRGAFSKSLEPCLELIKSSLNSDQLFSLLISICIQTQHCTFIYLLFFTCFVLSIRPSSGRKHKYRIKNVCYGRGLSFAISLIKYLIFIKAHFYVVIPFPFSAFSFFLSKHFLTKICKHFCLRGRLHVQ
jgi:hypothetical protein